MLCLPQAATAAPPIHSLHLGSSAPKRVYGMLGTQRSSCFHPNLPIPYTSDLRVSGIAVAMISQNAETAMGADVKMWGAQVFGPIVWLYIGEGMYSMFAGSIRSKSEIVFRSWYSILL